MKHISRDKAQLELVDPWPLVIGFGEQRGADAGTLAEELGTCLGK